MDPARLGLWGLSEGAGWVVPVAAAKDDAIRFTILVSAPVTTPGQEVAWSTDVGLHRSGLPQGLRQVVARALNLPGGPSYSRFDPIPYLATGFPADAGHLRTARRRAAAGAGRRAAAGRAPDRGQRRRHRALLRRRPQPVAQRRTARPATCSTMSGWIKGLPDSGVPPSGRNWPAPNPDRSRRCPRSSVQAGTSECSGLLRWPCPGWDLPSIWAAGCGAGSDRVLARRSRTGARWDGRCSRAVAAVLVMEGAFVGAVGLGVATSVTGAKLDLAANGLWGLHRVVAIASVPLAVLAGFHYRDARRSGWSVSPLDRAHSSPVRWSSSRCCSRARTGSTSASAGKPSCQ